MGKRSNEKCKMKKAKTGGDGPAERAERRFARRVDAAWQAHRRGDRELGHTLCMRAATARRRWKNKKLKMKNDKRLDTKAGRTG